MEKQTVTNAGIENKRAKGSRNIGAKAAFGVALAVFLIYSLSVLFALVWTFLQSLKDQMEFVRDKISLPKNWLFVNYDTALFDKLSYRDTNVVGMFLNSLWFAVGSAVLSVFMHCVTGYCFSKYKFIAKETIFSFVLFTLVIPVVGTLPSLYKIIVRMKLNDSYWFLVTALGGFSGNFLIMYAFFKGIDWSYAEAAQIDGAGHFYIFFRIMLPLAAAPIAALTILGVIQNWNNYETPILFLDRKPTLAAGLYHVQAEMAWVSGYPVYFAGILISIVPILLLVSVFGNKVMKNMTMGGIKG